MISCTTLYRSPASPPCANVCHFHVTRDAAAHFVSTVHANVGISVLKATKFKNAVRHLWRFFVFDPHAALSVKWPMNILSVVTLPIMFPHLSRLFTSRLLCPPRITFHYLVQHFDPAIHEINALGLSADVSTHLWQRRHLSAKFNSLALLLYA